MRDLQFGLTGVYGCHPIDVSLPIVNEDPPSRPAYGKCFHIGDAATAILSLFSRDANGVRRSATVDIRSACRENSDIAIYIVRDRQGRLFLRTYIDDSFNGLFPLPIRLYE